MLQTIFQTSILPASIMFFITIGFAALCFLPMLVYTQSNKVAQFYWQGLWAFLAVIGGVAGANSTLMLLGVSHDLATQDVISGLLAAFVGFIVFGWFRIVGMASLAIFQRAKAVSVKTD